MDDTDAEATLRTLAVPPVKWGRYRTMCVVCGGEIGRVPQLVHGAWTRAVGARVDIWREGCLVGSGSAHRSCSADKRSVNLTGKPDYSGYDENGANPAYPPDHDPVKRGQEADAAVREHMAKFYARKQAKG